MIGSTVSNVMALMESVRTLRRGKILAGESLVMTASMT